MRMGFWYFLFLLLGIVMVIVGITRKDESGFSNRSNILILMSVILFSAP